MIYHLTTQKDWDQAISQGYYSHPSLATENFIHTSTASQVEATANRYYKGVNDLILLHIDESELRSPLKYELAVSVNEEFPHIYGVINLEAVVKVANITTTANGSHKIDLG